MTFSSAIVMQSVAYAQQSETQALQQQLIVYSQLRREEQELRTRVAFLEERAVQLGALNVPVDLALLLSEEQKKLEQLRSELETQTDQLKQIAALPPDQRANIEVDTLEQLVSDIKAKQEQVRVYESNLRFLEEKAAKFGIDIRLDLFNELMLTRENLQAVQRQISALEERMKRMWGIEPEVINDVEDLNTEKIRRFAIEKVAHKYETLKKYAQDLSGKMHGLTLKSNTIKSFVATKYDNTVSNVLEELNGVFFLECEVKRDLALETPKWQITCVGSQEQLLVELHFESDFKPAYLACVRYHPNGTKTATVRASLARGDLIRALKELCPVKQKKWWMFWSRSQLLPDDWWN